MRQCIHPLKVVYKKVIYAFSDFLAKDDDESFALALAQQFEEEEMAETEKCVRQSDNSEKVRQMESLFQHKPKLLASADNPTPEIPVLKT